MLINRILSTVLQCVFKACTLEPSTYGAWEGGTNTLFHHPGAVILLLMNRGTIYMEWIRAASSALYQVPIPKASGPDTPAAFLFVMILWTTVFFLCLHREQDN